MSGAWPYVAAILPTILVAIFFYFIVKSILEGDRRERTAQKKYEQEQDARRATTQSAPENPAARGPQGPTGGPGPTDGSTPETPGK